MSFLICLVPVAPLRKEAAHSSEMVSQLLFGEMVELLEAGKSFSRVKCVYDGYEGWCQNGQIEPLPDSLSVNNAAQLNNEWTNSILWNGVAMHIPMGSSVGLFAKAKQAIGPHTFTYAEAIWDPAEHLFSEASILSIAKLYLQTPYLWGGRSVFGIDCSGYVQQVFRFFGIKLPRDAYQQAEEGELVGFLQEALCGDLAFFDNADGRIIHVGIMLDPEHIIHASGKVRIDKIDNGGIIHTETGERTHQLRIVKRYHQ